MKILRNEGVDIDAGFIHSVRPAARLKPAQTTAPNSVFSLGGEAQASTISPRPAKERQRRSPSRQGRALATIDSCGPMTTEQFASAMELSPREATKLLWTMKSAGKIERVMNGKIARYSIATGQAVPAASLNNSRRPSEATTGTPDVTEPTPDPELSCAIFNTGAMLIEVPNSPPLRLMPRHVAELIGYLRTLQRGLQ